MQLVKDILVKGAVTALLAIFGFQLNAQIIEELKVEEEEIEVEEVLEAEDFLFAPDEVMEVEREKVEVTTGRFFSEGKYGYKVDSKITVPASYDEIWEEKGVLLAKQQDKWGIISVRDSVIIPCEHSRILIIGEPGNLTYRVYTDSGYGVLSGNNEFIIPAKYSRIRGSHGFYEVYEKRGGQMALFSGDGLRLTDYVYDNFFVLNKIHNYFCLKNDSLYAIVNKDKQQLTDSIRGLYGVGFFNYYNQMLSRPDNSPRFDEQRYIVLKDKNLKTGIYDFESDDFILSPQYDDFYAENNLNFIFEKNGSLGLTDIQGDVKIEFKYDSLFFDVQSAPYNGKVVTAVKGDKYGLINVETGKLLTELKYASIKTLYEGRYKAKTTEGYFVVLSEDGEVLNPGPFLDVGEFLKGRAMTFTEDGMDYLYLDGTIKKNSIQPHLGYTSFSELIEAFEEAMNSSDDVLLETFCEKIAPSQHIIEFMKQAGIEYQRFPSNITRYHQSLADKQQTYFNNLKHIKSTYFAEKQSISVDLENYDLSPISNRRNKSGRNYIAVDLVITVGDELAIVTFDHCLIIEGYVISFSDSIER